jgi:hypothetical protein
MIAASGSSLPIGSVVTKVAVDLVGQNHQIVTRGEFEQLTPRRLRIRRPGRVVRIDHDERARVGGDQTLQVNQIGLPPPVRVGPIVAGARVDLREHRGVERIRRHRHEHLAAAIHERTEDEIDGFRRTRRNQRPIRRDRKTTRRELRGDRFPCRWNARRWAVAVVAVPHRSLDGDNQVRRGFEAESVRVPDVQVANTHPRGLDALRLGDDVPDGVAESVDPARDRNGCRQLRHAHAATIQRRTARGRATTVAGRRRDQIKLTNSVAAYLLAA